MIKNFQTLTAVKAAIKNLQNKPVAVTLNLGRNKFVSYEGQLNGVYPALFTINPFDKSFKGKTSYSYQEFMCGRVRLKELKDTIV